MLDALLIQLLSEQSTSGAFPSVVGDGGQAQTDETCFVTAQIACILADLLAAGVDGSAQVRRALGRALDFVEACESPDIPGAFLFYPSNKDTPRLPIRLAPDGDDTALAWLTLMHGGRRSQAAAAAVLPSLFGRLRSVAGRRGDPPWARAGVYRTWFSTSGSTNPVDIVVNANILACQIYAGCAVSPALNPVAAIVNAACCAADMSASSLRSLAPFYADATELEIALDRAVSVGATALLPALRATRAHGLLRQDRQAGRPVNRPLYCNAHGRPRWRSASLQRARRCQDVLSATPYLSSSSVTGGHDVVHA
jgi:hypothetical protein